ncbi:uncharacterized protein N7496_008209 [Penicillium cataractarum]|uniref:RING-type E3 ubiquitin transferase n=1 Tax=Penicillium cataractarum TaxID=2100454 RepID=A0A9W9S0J3_9EURO|nr:uncharacterized protein N7496_008209 [Penicillium cataractarum]KAJ5368449.1 hypothetical protein N7496_008209 [Penicillium cataractarum]
MGLWHSYSSFLSFFFLIIVPVLADLSVLPTNDTHDLAWSSSARFRIQGSSPLNGQILAPLTHYLVNLSSSQAQSFDVAGTITEVTATNSLAVNSTKIACIPCDDSAANYPGELGVDQTVQSVITAADPAAAIILYSTSSTHCNLTTDDQTEAYRYIFTFRDLTAVANLTQTLSSAPNKTVSIIPMSYQTTTTVDTSANTTGDSPNTAMIILYSITGIITALFLGIIITGAVRAHRHPERYGPRRVAGRPRQSRARGIAQAMLDTIPVVKFGDTNGVDAAKRDVEMANAEDPAREHSPHRSDSISDVGQTTPRETELPNTENDVTEQPAATATESNPNAAPDGGNFSCPICTDDFIKGQDLRVLPCNHQFHPECIDPWLVNVSGTCPLCRIDLNPPKTEDNAEQEGENADPQSADAAADTTTTPTTASTQSNRHSHRLTNYLHGPLNARRMRNATVEERLAALRHVREANQGETTGDDETTRPNRNRLSTRLRDRFRIRTRAHGVDTTTPVESGAATPTVPPAAHTTN